MPLYLCLVIIYVLVTNHLSHGSVLIHVIPSYGIVYLMRITHVLVCVMTIMMVAIISNFTGMICYRYEHLSVYINYCVYSTQIPSQSAYLRACFIVSLAMFYFVFIHSYLTCTRRSLMATYISIWVTYILIFGVLHTICLVWSIYSSKKIFKISLKNLAFLLLVTTQLCVLANDIEQNPRD
jgi:hypothetical protein